MNKTSTCCFFGDRKLPKERMEEMMKRLNREIDRLISQGVRQFVSGGAPGFDQVAASLIVVKKEMGADLRLIFALPFPDQEASWALDQKRLYRHLLQEADEVVHVSQDDREGCMKKRNRYMADQASVCICALLYPFGSASQAIQYARQKGVKVINVANDIRLL